MKLVKLYFMIVFVCSCLTVMAGDTIIVKKDPRMDMLSAKQVQANKRTSQMTSTGLYKGFRIQVLSTNNRNQAFDLKNTLSFSFPEHKTYVAYVSPNFKVRIGNFLKREDAENFRKQLLKTYPEGLYIVEDTVEYVEPEEEDEIFQ
jgi:hypothetical protein